MRRIEEEVTIGQKIRLKEFRRRTRKREALYDPEEVGFYLRESLGKAKEPAKEEESFKEETKVVMICTMNMPESLYFKSINYQFWSIKMRSFLRLEDVWQLIEFFWWNLRCGKIWIKHISHSTSH